MTRHSCFLSRSRAQEIIGASGRRVMFAHRRRLRIWISVNGTGAAWIASVPATSSDCRLTTGKAVQRSNFAPAWDLWSHRVSLRNSTGSSAFSDFGSRWGKSQLRTTRLFIVLSRTREVTFWNNDDITRHAVCLGRLKLSVIMAACTCAYSLVLRTDGVDIKLEVSELHALAPRPFGSTVDADRRCALTYTQVLFQCISL